MKKRMTMLLLAAIIAAGIPMGEMQELIMAMAAKETDLQTEGDYRYTVSNGEAAIVKYTGHDADISIPGALGGFPVTEIGDGAFFNHGFPYEGLKHVSFPDSVVSIGKRAFFSCGLEELFLPPGLVSIGDEAFWGCTFKELVLPSGLASIGHAAFSYTPIKTVTIPDKVVNMDDAFSDCKQLETVVLSDHVAKFRLWDFDGNSTLKTIKVGKYTRNIDMIGHRWDVDDPRGGMEPELEVPADSPYFEQVGDAVYSKDGKQLVFFSQKSEADSYTVRRGTKEISGQAFYECRNLKSVMLPDTLETIGYEAFCGCASLKSAALPDRLKVIGDWAFYKCPLPSVNLPPSLKSVGEAAYFTADAKAVTVGGKNTEIGSNAFPQDITLLCAKNAKAAGYFEQTDAGGNLMNRGNLNTKGRRIIYTLNGGVNHEGNAYYFTKTRSLKTPYREGYRFAGWYTDKACTKKVIKATKGKSLHIYAKWAKL